MFQCTRCLNDQSLDTLYCTIACQNTDWNAGHQEWHDTSEKRHEFYENCLQRHGENTEEIQAKREKILNDSGVPVYDKLLAEGDKLVDENNHKEAAKIFSKAIKLEPENFKAYYTMGLLYHKEDNFVMMVETFLNVMKYSKVGEKHWCLAFLNVHEACQQGGENVVQPSWYKNTGRIKVMAKMSLKYHADAFPVLANAISTSDKFTQADLLIAARLFEIFIQLPTTDPKVIPVLIAYVKNLRQSSGYSLTSPITLPDDLARLVQPYLR